MCAIDVLAFYSLGSVLQNRPVRAISLFDTQEMLMHAAAEGEEVSVEAQTGIRVFRDADMTMQLNQARRFVPDDPLPLFLQSLRRADASRNVLFLVALKLRFRTQNRRFQNSRFDKTAFWRIEVCAF